MRARWEAVRRLWRAELFVLVTEDSSLLAGDFTKDSLGLLILAALKDVRGRLDEAIKEMEALDGGNQLGRSSSRSKKPRE